MTSTEFGVYVHIPFCRHRCDYCAFATWTDRDHLMETYVDAVVEDIARAVANGMPPADTVFFGGGTPTRLAPELLARIVTALPVSANAEVTVECNPDDVTNHLMRVYADVGVNRVSIGVQAMVDHVLVALGRTHDPSNVERAISAARSAGISSINLDVMYGAHGESLDDWRTTMNAIVALRPTHVSAYGLTVEAGTPLADDPSRHPDDDDQADKYIIADEVLVAGGFVNYEISNWAQPGHECRHNMVYWMQGNYQGFGCAAHSHHNGRRWWNVRTPDRYIACVAAGESVEAADEVLDSATRSREALELSLRTSRGVPVGTLDPADLGDLVKVEGERIVLTRNGRLLANDVSLRLKPR
ncbi:MAG: radical SAM family heme chaperone HemW [Acidimicrobiaceae bacterium]|jgi:putative oxygen-independent coproporphyrinogen III oxidase|nr:radical SAM family heme chaperone HemW [Ilumatobacteraceae bacterium]